MLSNNTLKIKKGLKESDKMANFVVQFLLETEIFQEDILNKRFEIGRKIYNTLANITFTRYKQMIKTKKYREVMEKYKCPNSDKTPLSKKLANLQKIYGISEYAFHADVKNMQKHFKTNIDSFTAQKLAT